MFIRYNSRIPFSRTLSAGRMNLTSVSLGLGYSLRIRSIDLFRMAGTRNVPDCAINLRFIAYGSPSQTNGPDPVRKYLRKLPGFARSTCFVFSISDGLHAQITPSLVALCRAKNAAT